MDSSRFKQYIIPLNATLFRIAYRIVRDADVAKDMVQDTFIALWHKREILDELVNVESFAVKVLKNRCIDYLRTTHIYNMIDDAADVVDENLRADALLENGNRLSGIMLKLEKLPYRQKQILLMRSVQELSMDEIARMTGLSSINVRTLLSRARKRLRELCESELMEL